MQVSQVAPQLPPLKSALLTIIILLCNRFRNLFFLCIWNVVAFDQQPSDMVIIILFDISEFNSGKFYINETFRYLFFRPLLISLSTMSMRFIQVVTTDRVSYPWRPNNIPLCIYNTYYPFIWWWKFSLLMIPIFFTSKIYLFIYLFLHSTGIK